MVVIADDLTGAADCAASSAALGCRTVVLLHSLKDYGSDAGWPEADIISIDANSRCLPAEVASDLTTQLIRRCDSHSADCSGYVLFKKIDSTLRGNVASELVALLHARRSIGPPNAKLSILMAPALPAQGRTTVRGRLLIHGVPLEKTDIWKTEARTAQSDISRLLADGSLSCGLIDTETVRSGLTQLRQAILQFAKQVDVVVCDANTDADLRAIAHASLGEPTITALVGSAGLASQIPQAIGIAPGNEPRGCPYAPGSTLFVVGTAASVSRQQARRLEAIPEIATFHATRTVLDNSQMMRTQFMQSLQSGRDVLLVVGEGEHCSKQLLPQALSDLVSKCAPFIGGLVATGGATARAVLDAIGIHRLRLLGEVESGLPFSVAACWSRPLPIITKAGAFGSPQALIRCREFLRGLEHVPVRLHANDPLLDDES
jgi:4-hydroxythreonine-4-phosphate dehydrogenase